MRRSIWISMAALMLPLTAQAEDYVESVIQPVSSCSTDGICCPQQAGCQSTGSVCGVQPDSICCNPCACSEPPQWMVSASWLMLQRQYLSHAPIIVDGGTGARVVGSKEFNTGYESGFEIAARRALSCNTMVEARYFQINDFNDDVSRTTLATDSIAGTSLAPAAGLPQTLTYNSDLRSLDISLVIGEPCAKFRFLTGFRYISYDETFSINIPGAGRGDLDTENDLYGFQLGTEFDIVRNPCGFYLSGFNRCMLAVGETNSDGVGSGALVFQTSDHQNVVAGSSEFGVRSGYRVNSHLSLDATYRGMFLYGVALAGEQVSSTTAATSTTTLNHGDVFFHGFTAGATLSW